MAQACCISNINYGDLNTNSIDEIWKGEAITKLREKFKQGITDKRCGACINREKAGHPSLRTETNAKYGDSIDTNLEYKNPIYWDIRFSNVCNFKCRTCWHGNSSKWFEDSLQLKNNASDKAIIKAFDNESIFFSEWTKKILDYKEIYFAGGEPLVAEEHYKMLMLLLEHDRNDIKLKYNTNLSVLDFKQFNLIELWKRFANLTIDISIDHIKTKGEYIRKGLKWDTFLHNFETLKRELPKATIKITPTISVFNILDIGAIHNYFTDNHLIALDDIELNILDRPNFYNIQYMPSELKKEANQNIVEHLKYLNNQGASEKTISAFHTLSNFLMNASKSPKGFKAYNTKLDTLREEKLEDVFPELLPIS